jgi:hypothetical protein
LSSYRSRDEDSFVAAQVHLMLIDGDGKLIEQMDSQKFDNIFKQKKNLHPGNKYYLCVTMRWPQKCSS